MLQNTLIFFLFLGPLVFFHELGHFFFARLFGVRVETFSIGFGKKLFQKKIGDTIYAFSLIPLGGYVKMFGEDLLSKDEMPEEERPFAFNHKTKWQRFWIVFGGPLANFIMAFFIYFFVMLSGEKVPEVRAGIVPQDNILYEYGLRSGDLLSGVNGHKVSSVEDLNFPESEVEKISVLRDSNEIVLSMNAISSKDFLDAFLKISPYMRSPLVKGADGKIYFVSSSDKPVEKGFEVLHYSETDNFYLFEVENENVKPSDIRSTPIELKLDRSNLVASLESQKYYPLDLTVSSIVMGSPADEAGIRQGDILLAIEGTKFSSFIELREFIQNNAKEGKSFKLSLVRDGAVQKFDLSPKKNEVEGVITYTIGVYSNLKWATPQMIETDSKGFVASLTGAVEKTWGGIVSTLASFKKLITAQASFKSLGGPLSIGKVAADSFSASLSFFFKIMAIMSINLGILNLFPIPVLDGGHIMFIVLEVFNRGPLNKKTMIIAQQIGLSLLLMLMVVALFNDVTRFFFS